MSYSLIFDFDGTILDTETPAWDSMVEVWKSFGLELPLDWWLKGMVLACSNPWRLLLAGISSRRCGSSVALLANDDSILCGILL